MPPSSGATSNLAVIAPITITSARPQETYRRNEQLQIAPIPKLATNPRAATLATDRKSTRLNSSHVRISYAVFCLKKNNTEAVVQIRAAEGGVDHDDLLADAREIDAQVRR